jgi:hypothetical protein
MANESEQVEGGEPVATAKTLLTTTTAATINGNGSQEPSPTLQVPSIIPSIKITKVNINYSDTRDVTLLFISPPCPLLSEQQQQQPKRQNEKCA